MKLQIAVAALAAAAVSFAQEAAPDGAEANKDVTVTVNAKDSLDDAFAEYAEKRGFLRRKNREGQHIL